MTLRDDHLRVRLGAKTILLPDGSREALVARLHPYEAMRDVREALEQEGGPQGVSLTTAQKSSLLLFLEQWATEVSGRAESMPSGIISLRDGLRDFLTEQD